MGLYIYTKAYVNQCSIEGGARYTYESICKSYVASRMGHYIHTKAFVSLGSSEHETGYTKAYVG